MRHVQSEDISTAAKCDRCGQPSNSTYEGIRVKDRGARRFRPFRVCKDCEGWAMMMRQKDLDSEVNPGLVMKINFPQICSVCGNPANDEGEYVIETFLPGYETEGDPSRIIFYHKECIPKPLLDKLKSFSENRFDDYEEGIDDNIEPIL